MAKTLIPCSWTRAAATASVVESGLEGQSLSWAPPAWGASAGDPGHAEASPRKRSEDIAIEHSGAQDRFQAGIGPRQVAEQPAGEGVAGAGWVAHHVQWHGRRHEGAITREEDGAVLALL